MKGSQIASEVKFNLDYSKWIVDQNRAELWEDSVNRVMGMHRNNPKFQKAFENKRFVELFELAHKLYSSKTILGSNRALQFGGNPIMKHNSKMYNCLSSHCNRVDFFSEAAYWLMAGCGIGYSVQIHHVDALPSIKERKLGVKKFIIEDSIEGWADALGILVASFFNKSNRTENQDRYKFIDYSGYTIHFDYSQIRPKGAEISGGFKAPGPDGLKKSLEKIEQLFSNTLKTSDKLRPIDCYDIICHFADAVLSGGVRRSATICLFSKQDEEMMTAKDYTNHNRAAGLNPQRARSNNSVVLKRDETSQEEFEQIVQRIKDWGEPGFFFVDDLEQTTNPCVEIGMYPVTSDGQEGWQGCNLTTSNGRHLDTKEKMMEACIGMAVLGTLQAAYTDFVYVNKSSKTIFEEEALLGCSITGWMNNPDILLNEQNMQQGAQLILDINEEVANIIGINPAARTTCVKPEGNTSVLLECASGCHGEHSENYFRLMQINKGSEVAQQIQKHYPFLLEESVWSSTQSDYVLWLPIESDPNSIFKSQLVGINQLEVVKKIQQNWVEYGTRLERCKKPYLRHNVSNTVDVAPNQWNDVAEYIFNNRSFFTGVSFLGTYGDKDFKQAPFTSVLTARQILDKYGDASIFGSGLIVDGLHAFDNDLWNACQAVTDRQFKLSGSRQDQLLQKDWIRRCKQYAKRYFKNDINQAIYCLKDLHIYHKWVEINRLLKEHPPLKIKLQQPIYTDVDTMGSASCVGGACELPSTFLDSQK